MVPNLTVGSTMDEVAMRFTRKRNSRKPMASVQRRYSKDEFARRGDQIYQEQIQGKLDSQDEGKFVAIDIDTGKYEVDADELTAGNRLRARLPDAQTWMVRVGSR